MAEHLEQRRMAEERGEYKAIRRGWFWGNEALKPELLGQMNERLGENHYAAERQEGGEVKARKIVVEELKRLGWSAKDLGRRAKGDAGKVEIAWRLRAETTMTLKWIAERLAMGSWKHLNGRLYEQRRKSKSKQ